MRSDCYRHGRVAEPGQKVTDRQMMNTTFSAYTKRNGMTAGNASNRVGRQRKKNVAGVGFSRMTHGPPKHD